MDKTKIYRLVYENKISYYDSSYEDICCKGFLQGLEQIFESNRSSSEDDIIGVLCNDYFFVNGDIPLNAFELDDLFKDYDFILPYSGIVSEGTVHKLLVHVTNILDISELIEGTIEPFYLPAFRKIMASELLAEGGLCITRVKYFKEMYGWVANVFDKLLCELSLQEESILLITSVLSRVWLMSHSYCICEQNTIQTGADKYSNGRDKIALLKKYMDVRLCDLVEYHKSIGFSESLAENIECEDNFDNKIPVWVCWWQGQSEMPELVQACFSSIVRNIPEDIATIRLISMDNVSEYVTFTDGIIQKFNEGKISFTHLSDVLRSELLYRYGGMWIDLTIYVSGKIDKKFFLNTNLYTIAFERPLWGLDIMEGRWTTSLWVVPPRHPVMQFLMEGLWMYWDMEDEPIDYFFMDYVLDVGYRNFTEIRDAIESSPKSTSAVYDLQLRLNQAFTDLEKTRIASESLFYKINRRYEYKKRNCFGQQTIFGYLVEGNNGDVEKCTSNTVKLSDPKFEEMGDSILSCLLNIIREVNPKSILDADMVMVRIGMISRMTMKEVCISDLRLDAINVLDEISPVYYSIYDNIWNSVPDDISDYDLIIKM